MANAENQRKVNEELKSTVSKLNEIKEDVIGLDDAFVSLGTTIDSKILKKTNRISQDVVDVANKFKKELVDSINKSSKSLDQVEKINEKIKKGQDATKDIEKERAKLAAERNKTDRKLNILKRLGFEIDVKTVVQIEEAYQKKLDVVEAQEEINEKQKESVGIIGKLSKSISGFLKKIGLGAFEEFFNFEKSTEKAAERIAEIEKDGKGNLTQFQKQKIVTEELFKNLDHAALAAGALFAAAKKIFDFALKVEQKTTDLARNLSISKDEAKEIKNEMTSISLLFEKGITGVSFKDQLEGIQAMQDGLGGVALAFDQGTRVAAAETLKRLKLSEESVGNMGALALATSRSFEELEDQQIESVVAAEKEFGIRLSLKNVLEDANKITGLARVNIEKFPGGLTKAVSVAKSLGVEMEAVSSAASSLLDFESSIQKELEAELLIGRDLNLERARSAALAGDQEALMKELVAEAGSLEQLQNMNVLQQEALAAALGMSADQLADQVLNGEALATQKDEELSREASAAELAEKQLSAAEMQVAAMEKLSDIFSFAFPVLVGLAAAAAAMAVAISGGLAAPFITKGIVQTGIAVGATAGIAASMVGDATLPPGGPYEITDTSKPFGSTVITTKGDGVAVSPNIRQEGAGGGSMAENNRLLKAVLRRPAPVVNLDSIEFGTISGMSAFPIS